MDDISEEDRVEISIHGVTQSILEKKSQASGCLYADSHRTHHETVDLVAFARISPLDTLAKLSQAALAAYARKAVCLGPGDSPREIRQREAMPLSHAKMHATLLEAMQPQSPQTMTGASSAEFPLMSPPGGVSFLQVMSASGPWDSARGPTEGLNAIPAPIVAPSPSSSHHQQDPVSDRSPDISMTACVLRALMAHIGPTAGCVIERWMSQSGWEEGRSCEMDLPKDIGETEGRK